MDNGVLALIASPFLALVGVIASKMLDRRSSRDNQATEMVKALQGELARRDTVEGQRATAAQAAVDKANRRRQVLEDYAYLLRRLLGAIPGVEVPPWPPEETP